MLSTVKYGRLVFTRNALPAVRPVNHLLDEDEISLFGSSARAIAGRGGWRRRRRSCRPG
ncbi:pyridoxamine 5'-phosphate oxidase family protein [Kribbella koreensis]|uniref:pyridoxamine 5'-phosphate oxidase family protein n=1 Tax=Kribbella TaxID=182639 RepID=UPI003CD063B3